MGGSFLLHEHFLVGVILIAAVVVVGAIAVWATGVTPLRTLARFAPGWRLTRPGYYWLLLTFLLFAVGWLKALNLILLLAYLLLGAFLLNLWLAGRGLHSIHGERRVIGPVFAGVPFTEELEIESTGTDVIGVRVEDRGPAHELYWFAPRLPAGAPLRWSERLVRPRRCLYACEPLRAISGYPFGLVQRAAIVAPGMDVIVLPALGRLDLPRFQRFLQQATMIDGTVYQQSRPQLTAPSELHGMRPYRPGESLRWIHWRTTARRGELMVREFTEATGDDLLLVVDPYLPAGPVETPKGVPKPRPEEALLEDALSLAATICWEWCRHPDQHFTLAVAGPAPFVVSGGTGRAQAMYLLERLAAVGGTSASCPDRLLAALADARLTPAPVLVVGSRASDLHSTLADWLQRPVAAVDATHLDRVDFFERPAHGS